MRLIILSAVALSAAGLQHGLTHLWTTPILRHQLVGTDGPDADLLQAMQSAVRHKWSSFADDCGLTAEGETVNDRFFAYQREAFERGDAPFLELEGSKAEREAYETLRSAWLENAREYVAIVASEEAAADMFDDLDALRMFVWASVHEERSTHVPHDHANSAMSGVFYVAVPPRAGRITFDDPRSRSTPSASRSPFDENRLEHEPSAGELLLFPPWLVHSVGSSSDASGPRISISFNLFTMREDDSDLEALAETSVAPYAVEDDGDEEDWEDD